MISQQCQSGFDYILSICLSVLLCSCNSISVDNSIARLETPEVRGRPIRSGVLLGIGTNHNVKFTDDASKRPPSLDNPHYNGEGGELIVGVGMGISRFADVSLRTAMRGFSIEIPIFLQGKVQVLGHSLRKADKGNFSLAFTAGMGGAWKSIGGDQDGTFGSGGHNWSARGRNDLIDYAMILGYRFNKTFIVYGGPFRTRNWVNIKIRHAQSDDGTSPAETYRLQGSGGTDGVNLGVQWKVAKRLYFLVEGIYTHFFWTDNVQSRDSMALAFGGSAYF